MKLELNKDKSTPHQRFYKAGAATVKEFFGRTPYDQPIDFPNSRAWIGDEFGVDMSAFPNAQESSGNRFALKEQKFTQPYDQDQDGQTTVEFAYIAGGFETKPGKGEVFTTYAHGHFSHDNGIQEDEKPLIRIGAAVVYNGSIPCAWNKGVFGTRVAPEGKKYQLITPELRAVASALTQMRYLVTDNNRPVEFTYHGMSSKFRSGEVLHLDLTQQLDVPWLLSQSRRVLEGLANDEQFQGLVAMDKAIYHAQRMRSDAIVRDHAHFPLWSYIKAIDRHQDHLVAGGFDSDILANEVEVKAAVEQLEAALDTQLGAAKQQMQAATVNFMTDKRTDDLEKLLRAI